MWILPIFGKQMLQWHAGKINFAHSHLFLLSLILCTTCNCSTSPLHCFIFEVKSPNLLLIILKNAKTLVVVEGRGFAFWGQVTIMTWDHDALLLSVSSGGGKNPTRHPKPSSTPHCSLSWSAGRENPNTRHQIQYVFLYENNIKTVRNI